MEKRSRHLPRAFGAVAVACVVDFAVVYLVVSLQQRASPPSCFGIGFGCEPGPSASVFLWAVFTALPATVVTALLLLVSLVAPTDSLRRWVAYGIAGVYVVAALVAPLLFTG